MNPPTEMEQLQGLSKVVSEIVTAVRERRTLSDRQRWLLAIASGAHNPGAWPPPPAVDVEAMTAEITAEAESIVQYLADLIPGPLLEETAARLQALNERAMQ